MTDFGTNPPPGSRIRPQTPALCGADGKETEIPIPRIDFGVEHEPLLQHAAAEIRPKTAQNNNA